MQNKKLKRKQKKKKRETEGDGGRGAIGVRVTHSWGGGLYYDNTRSLCSEPSITQITYHDT